MYKFYFALLAFCFLLSCDNNKQSADETNETTEADVATEQKNAEQENVDINKVPVSTANTGAFPYLSAPQSYRYLNDKTKEYEEKLFFYNDSLTYKVGGKYFHAQISPIDNIEFEETYVVNNYKNIIEKLGGVELYSGSLQKTYNKVVTEDLPYLKDLYDPYAYKYKQFVIKTQNENIWIELIHGLNNNTIDFTVVKEEKIKETISIIQAEEIEKQLNDIGKAILYITFDTDKSTLQADGQQIVDEIAKMLNKNTSLKLSIEGHTDNTGTQEHNKTLSQQRTETVLNSLVSKGIAHSRLQTQGFGSEKPLVSNDSEENKAKNRRVELIKR